MTNQPLGYETWHGTAKRAVHLAQSGAPYFVAMCLNRISMINRTATDGCFNANSMLYRACWRIASAMGYRKIITYNQEGESGSSLRAAGFSLIRSLPARKGWADSSIKLKHKRDPVGTGGIKRNRWERA